MSAELPAAKENIIGHSWLPVQAGLSSIIMASACLLLNACGHGTEPTHVDDPKESHESITDVKSRDGGAPTVDTHDAGTPEVVDDNTLTARGHLDSWGVNLNSSGDVTAIAERLNFLGVRRIRAHLVKGRTSNLSHWQSLQNIMIEKGYVKPQIKLNDLIVAYNNDPTTWDNRKPLILEAAASGILQSIEGPNEMNNRIAGHGTHGVNNQTDMTDRWPGAEGNVKAWAQAIHSWKAGLEGEDAAAMAHVEIISPSIASGSPGDYARLPDISSLVDYGNLHYYAGLGRQPNLGLGADKPNVMYFANMYRWSQDHMSPTKSVAVTEAGATTPGREYSLRAQAAYILNQIHDAAGIGAKRLYIYCMIDPSTGSPGAEGNFGILNTDLSPKPAAVALSNVKHLFSLNNNFDDEANAHDNAPFTPGYDAAGLSVSGIGESGFSSRVADAVVYPKSDGSTVISVTNQSALCDKNARDLTPAPVTATVDFGSIQTWRLYDVFSDSPLTPVASGTGSSTEVVLRGYPMYLILDAPAEYRH